MKDRILIIGYGSPIRGDDAIGPLVADRLIDAIQSERVVVYSRHILTAELVGEVADAAMVIFLDASVEGVPGEVCCRPLTPDPDARISMAHFLDPRELLAWVAALYGQTPPAYLITATAQTFDYAGYQLSPTAEAAVQPMIDWTYQLIDQFTAVHGRPSGRTQTPC
jgi:hydrogenase maturation protease